VIGEYLEYLWNGTHIIEPTINYLHDKLIDF